MNHEQIDKILRAFCLFLDRAQSSLAKSELVEMADLGDWCQANWELLVEGALSRHLNCSVLLEPYGGGADINGRSSRVIFPEALPTHRILCRGRSAFALEHLSHKYLSINEAPFYQFVSWNGRQYEEVPPFQYVLLKEDEFTLFALQDVRFDVALLQSF